MQDPGSGQWIKPTQNGDHAIVNHGNKLLFQKKLTVKVEHGTGNSREFSQGQEFDTGVLREGMMYVATCSVTGEVTRFRTGKIGE